MVVATVKDNGLSLKDEHGAVLRIKENICENAFEIRVYGNLAASFISDFEDEMLTVLTLGKDIHLDLSNVDTVCGGILNVLLFMQKEIDRTGKGKMRIVAPSRPVQRLLDENGFYDLIDIALQ